MWRGVFETSLSAFESRNLTIDDLESLCISDLYRESLGFEDIYFFSDSIKFSSYRSSYLRGSIGLRLVDGILF